MPEKAHVTSVEAIEQFRTQLILYVNKARPALEEVTSEVLRMRLWLENDQRSALEGLVRRRRKELEQAQAALSSARKAVIRHETASQQMAVTRARRLLDEAEFKLKRVKYWDREFATVVEPLAKQLEKLHTVLSNDMNLATAHLARVVSMLGAYADVAPESLPDAGAGRAGPAASPTDAPGGTAGPPSDAATSSKPA
jgi:hypothetical protein